MNSAAVLPGFARFRDLGWKGVQVDQDEAGQHMSLCRFILGDAVDFVDGIITYKPEAMRPFLQRFGQQSLSGQFFDALIQTKLGMGGRNLLCGDFKCPTVHGAGRLPVLSFDGVLCLNKGASNRARDMRRSECCLRFRKKFQLVYFRESGEISDHLAWHGSVGISCHNSYWHKAAVALEERLALVRFIRNSCFADKREPRVLSSAVRAVMHKGDGHA